MSQNESPSALPPLEWLRVFEAAARTGNFTAAAAELSLTQAAVSQRIRNLEKRLGAPLFVRLPRGVELTLEGDSYAPHVQAALTALHRSTTDLFGAPLRRLSVAATASVAQLWIAPRLAKFQRTFPDLQVSLITVQRQADYMPAQADLDVRFGAGTWPECQGVKMFDEILAPVVSPSLLKQNQVEWRRLPQIAISGPRYGWRDWAAAANVAPPKPPSLRFDTFVQALAAAISGAGVLLASSELISEHIETGLLARLSEPSIRMENGYWLTWPSKSAPYTERRKIVEVLCGVSIEE